MSTLWSHRWVSVVQAFRAFCAFVREPRAENAIRMEMALRAMASPAEVSRSMAVLREVPEIDRMLSNKYYPDYQFMNLRFLPPQSLGRQYYEYMNRYNLKDLRAQFFPNVIPKDDATFLHLRNYQTHDIWHVLTGYPATETGEISILGFYLAQFDKLGRAAASILMAPAALIAIGLLLHAVAFAPAQLPQYLRGFIEGWQRGAIADSILAVNWEEMWHRSVASLRREFHVPPQSMPAKRLMAPQLEAGV